MFGWFSKKKKDVELQREKENLIDLTSRYDGDINRHRVDIGDFAQKIFEYNQFTLKFYTDLQMYGFLILNGKPSKHKEIYDLLVDIEHKTHQNIAYQYLFFVEYYSTIERIKNSFLVDEVAFVELCSNFGYIDRTYDMLKNMIDNVDTEVQNEADIHKKAVLELRKAEFKQKDSEINDIINKKLNERKNKL